MASSIPCTLASSSIPCTLAISGLGRPNTGVSRALAMSWALVMSRALAMSWALDTP